MSDRPTIPLAMRFRALQRDHFACRYCGARPPIIGLDVDHVQPVALGGETTDANLVTACDRCNSGKGARSLPATPRYVATVGALVDVTCESLAYADHWGEDSGEEVSDADFFDDIEMALGMRHA